MGVHGEYIVAVVFNISSEFPRGNTGDYYAIPKADSGSGCISFLYVRNIYRECPCSRTRFYISIANSHSSSLSCPAAAVDDQYTAP